MMSSDGPTSPDLAFELVNNLDALSQDMLATAIETYRRAFREEPYREDFSELAARDALQYVITCGGYLVFGRFDERVITLAGGYPKQRGFFIEELAISPEHQGRGLGRASLRALINSEPAKSAEWFEIRTTVTNNRALDLYRSEGFVAVHPTEAVPYLRSDRTIAVDERTYLVRHNDTNEPNGESCVLRRVAVAYPSGNTTAVVFDQRLLDDRKPLNVLLASAISRQLPEAPEVEQCCFVTLPQGSSAIARMEMFGGEFCANAARSVVWLVTGGNDYAGSLEVSGISKPLRFEVVAGSVQLEMPLSKQATIAEPVNEGVLVRLEGISHIVVTDQAMRCQRTPRMLLLELLANAAYDLPNQPAVGVTYYHPQSFTADFCVWVRGVDTIFDETACGSGTSAIGIALASTAQQSIQTDVIQPSGETILTSADYDPNTGVTASSIAGTVKVLFDGGVTLS